MAASLRPLLRQLHRILRDGEGQSSLLERFDELTRILVCQRTALQQGHALTSARQARELLAALARERPDRFPPRFANTALGDRTIASLLDVLAALPPGGSDEDVHGLAYEDLVRNTFDKGDHQQFFTPRPVVELMVEMIGPELGGIVCDPACGTGGFLLQAGRRALAGEQPYLIGFEIDERLAWVAGINLELHGIAEGTIRALPGAGSLGSGVVAWKGQIDVILTNPPFGSDLSDPETLASFELGRGRTARRRGALFVERCLELLRPGGLLAIVLDDSILNGAANQDVRQLVCRQADVEAVVSLPETAFQPYASVRASILLLRKHAGPARKKPSTFFARAEQIGRRPNGEPLWRAGPDGTPMLDSDLPAISQAWSSSASAAVPASGRPLIFRQTLPEEGDAIFVREGHRLDLAYHHPARHEAQEALAGTRHPLRSVAEICQLRSEQVVPARDLEDVSLCYIGLAHIEAGTGRCVPVRSSSSMLRSNVRRCRAGDILFARLRPELRKACLVPADVSEAFVSPECLVLVPRRRPNGTWVLLPELLSLLLRSDLVYGQLVHLVTGIGRPRLSRQAVLAARLPIPAAQEQLQLWQAIEQAQQQAAALRVESQQLEARAQGVLARAGTRLLQQLAMPGP